MPVQHRLVRVDRNRRPHAARVFACHVDGGHQVGQFATAVDHALHAHCGRLVEQLVDAVDGDLRLPFLDGLMTQCL